MGVVKIPLYGTLGKGKFALVDEADAHKVAGIRWYLVRKLVKKKRGGHSKYEYYRVLSPMLVDGKHKTLYLHRMVMQEFRPEYDINHISGDTLDNTRSNLEVLLHGDHSKVSQKMKRAKRSKTCADGSSATPTSGTETSSPTVTDLGQL